MWAKMERRGCNRDARTPVNCVAVKMTKTAETAARRVWLLLDVHWLMQSDGLVGKNGGAGVQQRCQDAGQLQRTGRQKEWQGGHGCCLTYTPVMNKGFYGYGVMGVGPAMAPGPRSTVTARTAAETAGGGYGGEGGVG